MMQGNSIHAAGPGKLRGGIVLCAGKSCVWSASDGGTDRRRMRSGKQVS